MGEKASIWPSQQSDLKQPWSLRFARGRKKKMREYAKGDLRSDAKEVLKLVESRCYSIARRLKVGKGGCKKTRSP